ncbi:nitric oxide synthase-interacting protein homolog [Drosophila mojavensis]|uniref:nitric oxide synthase-interacting protein homolog n=1 Tax=Drosophila mojavensis TaxID=7230 RepID=UPI001CD17790|nr:nitric oxide synthase-interacting protein homolog [Drosophila mojavensis]
MIINRNIVSTSNSSSSNNNHNSNNNNISNNSSSRPRSTAATSTRTTSSRAHPARRPRMSTAACWRHNTSASHPHVTQETQQQHQLIPPKKEIKTKPEDTCPADCAGPLETPHCVYTCMKRTSTGAPTACAEPAPAPQQTKYYRAGSAT